METYQNEALAEAIETVRGYNPAQLAGMADCSTPTSGEDAGQKFLLHVAGQVADLFEYLAPNLDHPDELDDANDDGSLSTIADGAPDVYTATKWAEFVQLGAFNEDVSDYASGGDIDMDKLASIALYVIAERLALALAEEIAEAVQDAEDPTDSDPDEAYGEVPTPAL